MTRLTIRENAAVVQEFDTDDGPLWITLFPTDFMEVGELRIEVIEAVGGGMRLRILGRVGDNPA